jgi:hypothetical protein
MNLLYLLYLFVAAALAIVSLAFIMVGPRSGSVLGALAAVGLFIGFQHAFGIPADPDGRLSGEAWRVLAVAPLDQDRFLVSVRYNAGDIRTYQLHIAEPDQRDQFLKAAKGLKKGKPMVGHALRPRAGLTDDGEMGFQFNDAPLADPKGTEAAAGSGQQTAER